MFLSQECHLISTSGHHISRGVYANHAHDWLNRNSDEVTGNWVHNNNILVPANQVSTYILLHMKKGASINVSLVFNDLWSVFKSGL